MKELRGITFAPFCKKGDLYSEESRQSFDYMVEHTKANMVVFAPGAVQKTAHTEEIDYTSEKTFSDDELIHMIRYAKGKGLKVALKPTVNCLDGTWRAYVSFFDHEVCCEPKWRKWFEEYTRFQVHYAQIAEKENCDFFIAGCEMVMSEHRENEWRKVIAAIREVYSGMVSYNTDKYQEEHVVWWDCVDYISSSGYYPECGWEQELDRIEQVVKKYNKPFFFAEAGCMSRKGSKEIPNDWELQGELRLEEQTEWYRKMFEACDKRAWMKGFALWEWAPYLPGKRRAETDDTYQICKKPVQNVICDYYSGKAE